MGAKDDLIAAITADLPDGIRDHLGTVIPAMANTSVPADVDSAIIAQGVLAHNLNTIFQAFEGLPLAAIPMYISQLNTVQHGMLLAGLQLVSNNGAFRILYPEQGATYYGHFGITTFYTAQAVSGGIESLTVTVGGESFPLEQNPDDPVIWSGEWATGLGAYSAVFSAQLDGKTVEEAVNFSVRPYDTFPGDGDTVTEDTLTEVSVTADESATSGSADLLDADGNVLHSAPLVRSAGRLSVTGDEFVAAIDVGVGNIFRIRYGVQVNDSVDLVWDIQFFWE